MATLDTEIRKLQPAELYTLGQILNYSDLWKKVMAIIPNEEDENLCMFTNEHVTMIEQAIKQQQRSGADIFLSEWSTMGKIRPTCKTLLNLLIKLELFRAADYLAVDILKTNPPERPKTGAAASIKVSDRVLEEILKQRAQDILALKWPVTDNSMEVVADFVVNEPIEPMSNGQENTEPVNPIKLNAEKSDQHLNINLTTNSAKRDLNKVIDQVSDLMKFSINESVKEAENYILQEVQSEDIPVCVQKSLFQPQNKTSIPSTLTTEVSTITSSYTESESTINSEENSESVSQDIPIVVLRYTEKK